MHNSECVGIYLYGFLGVKASLTAIAGTFLLILGLCDRSKWGVLPVRKTKLRLRDRKQSTKAFVWMAKKPHER